MKNYFNKIQNNLFKFYPSFLIQNFFHSFKNNPKQESNKFSCLEKPHLIMNCLQNSINKTNNLMDKLIKNGTINLKKTIGNEKQKIEEMENILDLFSQISNSISKIADISQFFQFSHPDKEIQIQSRKCFGISKDFIQKLNLNENLYSILKEVKNQEEFKLLSKENQRVTNLLIEDFEESGICLSQQGKLEMEHIQSKIRDLVFEFNKNIDESIPEIEISEESQNDFLEELKNIESENKQNSKNRIISAFLKSKKEDIRKSVFQSILSTPVENVDVLKSLEKERRNFSKKLGYESYSHLALKNSIMETPENVIQFLEKFANEIEPRVCIEMDWLKKEKEKETKNYNSSSEIQINPWDYEYLSESILLKQFPELSNNSSFSLKKCFVGLKNIIRKQYGIILQDCNVSNEKIWDPKVKKIYALDEKTGELVGICYFDFYNRKNKIFHSGIFPISSGIWNRKLNKKRQIPELVVLFNFLEEENDDAHLTFQQVKILLHEFGHLIHYLLSNVEHHHVSGLRNLSELEEVPSILYEYHLFNWEIVRDLLNNEGNEDVKRITEKIKYSFSRFFAISTQKKVLDSLIDLKIHYKTNFPKSVEEIYQKLMIRYKSKSFKYCYPEIRLRHLCFNPSSHYKYLVSSCIASIIWKRIFGEDAFNKEACNKFKNLFLIKGGSLDSKEILETILIQSKWKKEDLIKGFIEMNLEK
ncbi:intermediate peptidase [Anaeramoeba ignava]|uniref:Intermediate peptidase n=1 Tax=Anaeramoeba ignava TaxID=1746090 RepID=A0A9Q0LXR2_ANAIG|nr:intermediate peptidase [Anaeramoeba ignava]